MYFSEQEGNILWMDYIERIINEENDLDHNVEGDAIESPVESVSRDEVLQVINEMKTENVREPSVRIIGVAASRIVGIQQC